MSEHPAGWYPDPEHPGDLRWHDGEQWTAHTRGTTTSPPSRRRRSALLVALLVVAVVAIVLLIAVVVPGLRSQPPAQGDQRATAADARTLGTTVAELERLGFRCAPTSTGHSCARSIEHLDVATADGAPTGESRRATVVALGACDVGPSMTDVELLVVLGWPPCRPAISPAG